MSRVFPVSWSVLLMSCCLLPAASGCPASEPQPARRTTARPAVRQPPARAGVGRVTIHPLWEAKTGQQQARVAQVKLGCVLVLAGPYAAHGTPQRELLCLAPATGKIRWRFSGGQAPLEIAATTSGVVTLRDAAGKHHFVDGRTGRRVVRPMGRLPQPRPKASVVAQGRRYTTEGYAVRCVHAQSGGIIWESPTRGGVSGLRVQGNTVYYSVAGERAIHARHAGSGLGQWLHQVRPLQGVKHPRAASFSFAVAEKRLIVARYDGSVGGFELRTKAKPRARAVPPRRRGGSVVPAGIPRSYVVCGCGCCGGGRGPARGRKVCLYWSKGQDIRKLIAQDKQAKKNPQCRVMGCSLGTWYEYCD